MKPPVALAFVSLACTATIRAQATETATPSPAYRTQEVVAKGDLSISLEYLPKASLADEHWLRWVFVNKGDRPIKVNNLTYRLQRTCHHPDTDELLRSGSGAAGGGRALLPWLKGTPKHSLHVQPGTHRYSRHVSRYESCLIGMPPEHGYTARYSVHFDIQADGIGRLTTPTDGLAVSLHWQLPDEASHPALLARLRKLLAEPETSTFAVHSYYLHALLAVQALHSALTLDELTKAMEARVTSAFEGRNTIAKRIHYMGFGREQLLAYFRTRLRTQDAYTLQDLAAAPHDFWDDSFLEPLLTAYEQHRAAAVMIVLDPRHARWSSDRNATRRLFDVLHERLGERLGINVADLPTEGGDEQSQEWLLRIRQWRGAAEQLAQSRDPRLHALLKPFLDAKAPIDWQIRVPLPGPLRPCTRICDVALELMMKVHYGDIETGYLALAALTGLGTVKDPQPTRHQLLLSCSTDAARDKLIERFKQVLAK